MSIKLSIFSENLYYSLDRDHRADRDHPAAPAREVRRPRGDQPPPGGAGHPRGRVHRHPGRRQGGVPPG